MEINNYNFQEIINLFPEIYDLESVPQNPEYHGEGNVFVHTRNVCREILNLKEWESLNDQEKFILYMAGMFHDIGKSVCTKIEDGKIISPKHAIIGSKMFRELIYIKYSEKYLINYELREKIACLIKYHGLPLLFLEKRDIDCEIIKASECVDMKLLYLLAKCDLLGRECNDKEELLRKVEYFKEYSIELGCYNHKIKFTNSYTRFLYFNKNNVSFKDEIYDPREFNVIIMVGIPLAGKDTYINENFSSLNMISLDDIREEFNISPKDGSKKVATIAKERVKELLRNKTSFVYNATNIMKDTRNSMCKLFSNYGAKVTYVYVETSYKELMKRYNKRERIVPIKVINNMIRKMDMIEEFEGERVIRVV